MPQATTTIDFCADNTQHINKHHTLSYIERKMGRVHASLHRSFKMCVANPQCAVPDITVHHYVSSFGGTVIFEVRDSDSERYMLIAGDIFSAHSLYVIDADEDCDEHAIAVIGTADGFSFVDYASICDAIVHGRSQIETSHIDGYYLLDEYYHNIASARGAYRDNIAIPLVLTATDDGELFGFSHRQIMAMNDGEVTPSRVGVPSHEPEDTYAHITRDYVRINSDSARLHVAESVHPCFATNYGIYSDLVASQRTESVYIPRLNCADIDVDVEVVYDNDKPTGILISHRHTDARTLSVYLHGGPEHYFTTAYDLISTDSVLAELVANSGAVYMPFLERSTDKLRTKDFLHDQPGSSIPILGRFARETASIISTTRLLRTIHDLDAGVLYSVSMGGHIALGILAFCAPDEINETFSRIVICNGLLDIDDPLNSYEFSARQKASLRNAIDVDYDPILMIGSEEWVQLNHSVDHCEISIITSADDDICTVDTASTVCDLLGHGDYPVTLFIDSDASGHRLSSGGLMYTISQIIE